MKLKTVRVSGLEPGHVVLSAGGGWNSMRMNLSRLFGRRLSYNYRGGTQSFRLVRKKQ